MLSHSQLPWQLRHAPALDCRSSAALACALLSGVVLHSGATKKRLGLQGSEYMSPDEIDSILRLQWKSLQGQSPYHEDYYFQASAGRLPAASHLLLKCLCVPPACQTSTAKTLSTA